MTIDDSETIDRAEAAMLATVAMEAVVRDNPDTFRGLEPGDVVHLLRSGALVGAWQALRGPLEVERDPPAPPDGIEPCYLCGDRGGVGFRDRQNGLGWWQAEIFCSRCGQSYRPAVAQHRAAASGVAAVMWKMVQRSLGASLARQRARL